jgi:transposase
LYFETFNEDELRSNGFSKDNKSQQPQIAVALMVTPEGFPIFHFKKQPIQLHILICFMALAISKHIEITASMSIRAFITHCKKITDARLLNKINRAY